jgi:hypothetical protein
MALNGENRTHLVNVALEAKRHHIALRFASMFQSISSGDKPEPRELAELEAAKAECTVADNALAGLEVENRA